MGFVLLKNINNVVAKAQPLAKGFEEIYTEEIWKDLPTCSKEIILALIAQKKWQLNVGEEIDRKFFVMPPKEAETIISYWKNAYMV